VGSGMATFIVYDSMEQVDEHSGVGLSGAAEGSASHGMGANSS